MYSRSSLTIIKPEFTYFSCLIFAQVYQDNVRLWEMLCILWIFKLKLHKQILLEI